MESVDIKKPGEAERVYIENRGQNDDIESELEELTEIRIKRSPVKKAPVPEVEVRDNVGPG